VNPDVSQFSISGVVTFRVITLCDQRSAPEVVAAYFCAPRGEVITNHELYGGMVAEIELETSSFKAAYSDMPSVERHVLHPDTAAKIEGFRFDQWPELARLAEEVHGSFQGIFSVGWDFVYTPDGFRLLEGNTLWGLHPGLFLGKTAYVSKAFEMLHAKAQAT